MCIDYFRLIPRTFFWVDIFYVRNDMNRENYVKDVIFKIIHLLKITLNLFNKSPGEVYVISAP